MQLKQWQDRFWHDLIGSDDSGSGLAIYQNNYYSQRVESLQKTFPACVVLIGEEAFNLRARQYVHQTPSVSFNIANCGEGFVDFLGADSTLYLAELACYEWAWHKVFHGVNHASISLNGFVEIAPNDTLTLTPDSQLLATTCDVATVWACCQPEYHGDFNVKQNGEYFFVLQQREGLVHTTALDKAAYNSLQRLPMRVGDWLEINSEQQGFTTEHLTQFANLGLVQLSDK